MPNPVLAFDVGATKTAWAVVAEDGTKGEAGIFPTPTERDQFLAALREVIESYPDIDAVGVGIAGVVSPDTSMTFVTPNVPKLSWLQIGDFVEGSAGKPCAVDNDGRCALIGEVWLGAAQDTSSAVMITIGTGIGGAVMQRHKVLPHPDDLSLEISRLVADPQDIFPAPSGLGTVEALIGGHNVEARYGVELSEMVELARKGDAEALEFWGFVQQAFHKVIDAIYNAYGSKMIIVGGRGAHDLELYLGDQSTPCPVVPAQLGPEAGILGAARIALDAAEEAAKDWDEE
jgi:glucokinase